MPLPSLKTIRQADINRLYDTPLPWVETAKVSGLADFPARMNYEPGFERNAEMQAGSAVAHVRKSDWPAPEANKEVTIIGVVWRVADIPEHANAFEWRLNLKHDQRLRF